MSAEQEQNEEYLDLQEVAEVVEEDNDNVEEPVDEDMDEDVNEEEEYTDVSVPQEGEAVDPDSIEIDLSNNSESYFDTHKDSIFTIATHPKLPIAVSGGGDNTAYLWTTHSSPAKLIGELTGHGESVTSSGFTNDGQYVITADMTGKVLIHKATKRGQVWVPHGKVEDVEEVNWIKVHPNQNVFAVGALDGSVWVYQIEPEISLIFSGFSHSMECTTGEFINVDNLDELKLITCSEDGSIIGWNCYTQQTMYKIEKPELKGLSPPWVSLGLNSSTVIASFGSRDSQVVIVNTETGNVLTMFKAFELKDGEDIYDASIESISWCDSLSLMALGLVSGDIFIFDTKTWRVRRSLKCGDAVTKLEFLKDTPYIYASSMEGKVHKWDARTGEVLDTFVGHHMGVLDFAFDCTGSRVITAGDEGVSLVFKA